MNFPTYTQTPACGYNIQTYTVEADSNSLPYRGFSQVSTLTSSFKSYTTDRTYAGFYTITF